MDTPPIAEWLPERYRSVLDRIAELDESGRHLEADAVRRAAIRAYSGSWTAKTAKRLDGLAERAERHLAQAPMGHRRGLPLSLVAWRIRRGSVGPAPSGASPATPTLRPQR